MALKDLVASNAALLEAAVEKIVTPYVRYDVDEKELSFTPEFAALSNRAKILVYFAALQGWRFVTEEPVPTAVKPSSLERTLGIPGGSLRPILRELNERHLLSDKDGMYAVRPANMSAIEAEISGQGATARSTAKPARSSRPKKSEPASDQGEAKAGESKVKKRSSGGGKGAVEAFSRWIDEGFFSIPRTAADVQAKFHDEAIIIPRTSIPKLFLTAVRAKRLRRAKQDANGKSVWAYEKVRSGQ